MRLQDTLSGCDATTAALAGLAMDTALPERKDDARSDAALGTAVKFIAADAMIC